MKSMTGFGRGESEKDNNHCIVEIKTVNNRYRDIQIKAPSDLNFLDPGIRRKLGETFSRGRIEVSVSFQLSGNATSKEITINKALAYNYLEALNELMNLNSMIETKIPLSYLADFPDVINVREETDSELAVQLLEEALDRAIMQCSLSRENEGENLKKDILLHLNNYEQTLDEVERLMPKAITEATEKLHQRLENILKDYEIDENRFLTEATIIADKLAIEEEVSRSRSHLEGFKKLVGNDSEAIGRQMDFFLQELNREANTIGSKSQNLVLSNLVVELKSEIEKIREQVQNVE